MQKKSLETILYSTAGIVVMLLILVAANVITGVKPVRADLTQEKAFTLSDGTKQSVEKDLAKGVRAFKELAKFDPYVAGKELTLADCAAAVHLPLVSLSTKLAYGRDFLDDVPQVKPYLKMLGERPAFAKVNADRKAAQEAARAKK